MGPKANDTPSSYKSNSIGIPMSMSGMMMSGGTGGLIVSSQKNYTEGNRSIA